MSCSRKECKRTFRGPPLYCRCSLEFCSEACFVSGWHAEHGEVCSRAEEIKAEITSRREQGHSTARGGTAQLVAVALTRSAPQAPAPSAPS
ncbi:unnamed protein product, partial [Polarella glacialis]